MDLGQNLTIERKDLEDGNVYRLEAGIEDGSINGKAAKCLVVNEFIGERTGIQFE